MPMANALHIRLKKDEITNGSPGKSRSLSILPSLIRLRLQLSAHSRHLTDSYALPPPKYLQLPSVRRARCITTSRAPAIVGEHADIGDDVVVGGEIGGGAVELGNCYADEQDAAEGKILGPGAAGNATENRECEGRQQHADVIGLPFARAAKTYCREVAENTPITVDGPCSSKPPPTSSASGPMKPPPASPV